MFEVRAPLLTRPAIVLFLGFFGRNSVARAAMTNGRLLGL
jgi:hypothetical protein